MALFAAVQPDGQNSVILSAYLSLTISFLILILKVSFIHSKMNGAIPL